MHQSFGIPFELDYTISKYDVLDSLKYFNRESLRAIGQYKKSIEVQLKKITNDQSEKKAAKLYLQKELNDILDRVIEIGALTEENWELLSHFHTFVITRISDTFRTLLKLREIADENKWIRIMVFDLNRRLTRLEENLIEAQHKTRIHYYIHMMRSRFLQPEAQTQGYLEDDDDMVEMEEPLLEVVKPINNLYLEYIQMRRYDVLERLLEDHIEKFKSQYGVSSLEVASLLSMLAKIQAEQGKLIESQNMYNKVLAIREAKLGKQHDIVGISKFKLSVIQFKRKLYRDADTNARTALAIRSKTLDKKHADIAIIQAHLGNICVNLGKWNDALGFYKPAVALFEEIYEENDIFIIRCHMNMATAYIKSQQNDKAHEMIDKLCREYQTKNMTMPITDKDSAYNKITKNAKSMSSSILAQQLVQKFGKQDKVYEKAIIDLLLEYFQITKQNESITVINEWAQVKNVDASTTTNKKQQKHRESIQQKRQSMISSVALLDVSDKLAKSRKSEIIRDPNALASFMSMSAKPRQSVIGSISKPPSNQ